MSFRSNPPICRPVAIGKASQNHRAGPPPPPSSLPESPVQYDHNTPARSSPLPASNSNDAPASVTPGETTPLTAAVLAPTSSAVSAPTVRGPPVTPVRSDASMIGIPSFADNLRDRQYTSDAVPQAERSQPVIPHVRLPSSRKQEKTAEVVAVISEEPPEMHRRPMPGSGRVRQWVRDPQGGAARPPKTCHPPPVPESTPKHQGPSTPWWLTAALPATSLRSASPTSLSHPPSRSDEEPVKTFAASWIVGDGRAVRNQSHSPAPTSVSCDVNSIRKTMVAAQARFGTASPVAALLSPPRVSAPPYFSSSNPVRVSSGSATRQEAELRDDGVMTPMAVYYAPPTPQRSTVTSDASSSLKLYDHKMLPRETSQWSTPQPVHVLLDRTP